LLTVLLIIHILHKLEKNLLMIGEFTVLLFEVAKIVWLPNLALTLFIVFMVFFGSILGRELFGTSDIIFIVCSSDDPVQDKNYFPKYQSKVNQQ